MNIRTTLSLFLVMSLPATAIAQDETVVPDEERAIAAEKGVEGPTETRGIELIENLGAIGLGEDFAPMEGRKLRVRRLTIAPGAVVGVHQHDARPGVAYILEGELIEVRNDADGPLTRKAGDTSFEKGDVIHWWRNESGKPAVALVVDIVPDET